MRLALRAHRVVSIGGPLPQPVGHRGWRERRGVLVELVDQRGHVGRGEASPLAAPELARVESTLPGLCAQLGELDADADPREAVRGWLGRLEPARDGGGSALAPSARFALETAAFDLLGQALGRSVAWCLTAGGADGFGPAEEVGVSGLLSGGRAESMGGESMGPGADLAMERELDALVARGVRTVKRKLGAAPFEAELAHLFAIRRRHPELTLRLDANQAWTHSDARANLDALAELCPELCEEPSADLARLGPCAVPWFADESLVDPELSEGLLPESAPPAAGLAGVVLKPTLLGGALRALELAARARRAGLDAFVTHAFEGPVALAAACELALAVGGSRAHGLDLHPALAAYPGYRVDQRREAGRVQAARGPGLGLGEERAAC